MKKRLICFFMLVIFLFSFVSSLELGLSPAYSNLNGKTNEKICQNFTINSDRKINVIIESKWFDGKMQSKNLKDYNLSAEKVGISLFGNEKIFVNKTTKTEICFSSSKNGNYYGIILFSSENGYATIGSWIKLEIKNNQTALNKLSLTGNVIKNTFLKPDNLILAFSILITLLSLIVLFFLLKKLKIKRSPEFE